MITKLLKIFFKNKNKKSLKIINNKYYKCKLHIIILNHNIKLNKLNLNIKSLH
jgi:hypothetical protein